MSHDGRPEPLVGLEPAALCVLDAEEAAVEPSRLVERPHDKTATERDIYRFCDKDASLAHVGPELVPDRSSEDASQGGNPEDAPRPPFGGKEVESEHPDGPLKQRQP